MVNTQRSKVLLNGWEYWVDTNKLVLYEKEESQNGVHFDTDGISLWSNHLTKNERQQLLDFIKYRL